MYANSAIEIICIRRLFRDSSSCTSIVGVKMSITSKKKKSYLCELVTLAIGLCEVGKTILYDSGLVRSLLVSIGRPFIF